MDPQHTRIKYMTDGHLVREMMLDPLLSQASTRPSPPAGLRTCADLLVRQCLQFWDSDSGKSLVYLSEEAFNYCAEHSLPFR